MISMALKISENQNFQKFLEINFVESFRNILRIFRDFQILWSQTEFTMELKPETCLILLSQTACNESFNTLFNIVENVTMCYGEICALNGNKQEIK